MWHESYLQPFFPGMHQLSSYFYVIFKNLQSIPKTAFFPFPLSALSSFPFFSRNSYFIFNRRIPREGFDLDFGFTKKTLSLTFYQKNFHPCKWASILLFIGFARYQLLWKKCSALPRYLCQSLLCTVNTHIYLLKCYK